MFIVTNTQYRFLKFLYRHGASRSDIQKHFPNYKTSPDLTESAFQGGFYRKGDMFYLTVVGKRAFEARRRDNFRFCFPLFISLVALVLSVISIFLQYF